MASSIRRQSVSIASRSLLAIGAGLLALLRLPPAASLAQGPAAAADVAPREVSADLSRTGAGGPGLTGHLVPAGSRGPLAQCTPDLFFDVEYEYANETESTEYLTDAVFGGPGTMVGVEMGAHGDV